MMLFRDATRDTTVLEVHQYSGAFSGLYLATQFSGNRNPKALVVLDIAQVLKLRDTLTQWLASNIGKGTPAWEGEL